MPPPAAAPLRCPDTGTFMAGMGPCLSLFDGNNDSKAYGWACDNSDYRQRWAFSPVGHDGSGVGYLRSAVGTCLALPEGSGSQPFGSECRAGEVPCMQCVRLLVSGDSAISSTGNLHRYT